MIRERKTCPFPLGDANLWSNGSNEQRILVMQLVTIIKYHIISKMAPILAVTPGALLSFAEHVRVRYCPQCSVLISRWTGVELPLSCKRMGKLHLFRCVAEGLRVQQPSCGSRQWGRVHSETRTPALGTDCPKSFFTHPHTHTRALYVIIPTNVLKGNKLHKTA